jgi:hypothetical protein
MNAMLDGRWVEISTVIELVNLQICGCADVRICSRADSVDVFIWLVVLFKVNELNI